MATLFVDKIDPQSGTSLSLGSSGDTLQATSGTTNNLGISEADQWRLSADLTCSSGSVDTLITANLERNDSAGFSKIGTGMTESSGIFTFPSTGIWRVEVSFLFYHATGGSQWNSVNMFTTLNDSAYTQQTHFPVSTQASSIDYNGGYSTFLFDVTDTSNCKVKFMYNCEGTVTLQGDSAENETVFVFTRLGDT